MVAGCFAYSLFSQEISPKKPVQLVVIGDSILGYERGEMSIPTAIADRLGMSVVNGTLGGTSASRGDREDRMDYSLDTLCFSALARAFMLEDFGVQNTVKGFANGTEYYEDTIRELAAADVKQAEVILILYGTNDYFDGRPLDNPGEPYDEYTFGGALRSGLRYLRSCNPEARILLSTPTYVWLLRRQQTCEEYVANGLVLEDYVEMIRKIGQEEQVEVVDLYHDFYPHDSWEDWSLYTVDGVHPNEAGCQLIADRFVRYLEEKNSDSQQGISDL